jgi:glycosyltransferase involved in cell wall biosynthesis
MRLSAIIIAKNEERDLPGCLESLKGVADEIVVVDGHSTDRTREIAHAYAAKVFENDFHGYGPQKQFALEKARGEWVLNIDADERLSPPLIEELRRFDGNALSVNGFSIPFRLYFMGKRLRFGGCYGERHIRLFRRAKARYTGKKIHEGIHVEPPLGSLSGHVEHISYRDFGEYLRKCELYTRLIAGEKFEKGGRFAAWHHLRLPWEFFVRYFLKLGFLDGGPGFTYAALSSYYAWLKHVRLLDLERGQNER